MSLPLYKGAFGLCIPKVRLLFLAKALLFWSQKRKYLNFNYLIQYSLYTNIYHMKQLCLFLDIHTYTYPQ